MQLPPAQIMMDLGKFVNPTIDDEEDYALQHCVCQPVTDCDIPPCKDSCECYEVGGAACSLIHIRKTRYRVHPQQPPLCRPLDA